MTGRTAGGGGREARGGVHGKSSAALLRANPKTDHHRKSADDGFGVGRLGGDASRAGCRITSRSRSSVRSDRRCGGTHDSSDISPPTHALFAIVFYPRTMARPAKRRGSRTTPKGGTSTSSGRYTPPIPREAKVSPTWVPVLMFTTLGLGMIIIVINYLGVLPGGADNWYLLGGLALITVGFVTATRFH